MDSQVSLALMAKAKLVFESDDTFLAFPVIPTAYAREDLDFDSGDPLRDVSRLCEFSLLVDRIPSGTIWSTTQDRRLSEFYGDVLRGGAVVASSSRTPAEDAAYEEAWKFLHAEDADGLPRDTAPVIAYNQCRDAYLAAVENFKNAQLTAAHSEDPAVKQRWTDTDQALLRGRVVAAEKRWNTEGRRAEVERARRVEATLGAKSAQLTWEDWASRFNPMIDLETDPQTRQTFAPTAFSPANALETGSWQRFTLVGGEVDALARTAPEELRARLGDDPVDLEVESVSFEYSSAGVARPWFVSDVFRSRFWKFDDPTKVASDGRTPPGGLCPAYVAGIVFARRLEVKPRANSTRNKSVMTRVANGEMLNFAVFGNVVKPAVQPGMTTIFLAQPAFKLNKEAPPRIAAHTVRDHRGAAAGATVVRDHRTRPAVVVDHRAKPGVFVPASRSRARLHAGFKRVPPAVVAPPPRPNPSPQPTPPQPTPPQVTDESITILAFICKRVPRSPDPDPSLQW